MARIFVSIIEVGLISLINTLSSNQGGEGRHMLLSSSVIQELIHHAWLSLSLTVRVQHFALIIFRKK